MAPLLHPHYQLLAPTGHSVILFAFGLREAGSHYARLRAPQLSFRACAQTGRPRRRHTRSRLARPTPEARRRQLIPDDLAPEIFIPRVGPGRYLPLNAALKFFHFHMRTPSCAEHAGSPDSFSSGLQPPLGCSSPEHMIVHHALNEAKRWNHWNLETTGLHLRENVCFKTKNL